MLNIVKAGRVFMALLALSLLMGSQLSYANWGRPHGGHDRGHFSHHYDSSDSSFRFSVFPNDLISISLGETRHRHYDERHHRRYVNEYVVVYPQPVTYVQPTPVFVNQASPVQVRVAANTFNGDDLYMINVPNDRNGYTSVTIKKAGNGFVGPQGEYYPEFPNVSQLKAMYVY